MEYPGAGREGGREVSEDQNVDKAAEKAAAVIKTIEEVRLHRKQDPKGYRETLKSFAIKLGLTWLFSRSK